MKSPVAETPTPSRSLDPVLNPVRRFGLSVSRLSGVVWRPALLFASLLCVLAGILRALGADRPSLFAIYSAGLLAGIGVVTGLIALPSTEGAAEQAEELI